MRLFCAAGAVGLCGLHALAGLSQSSLTSPGGFVQAGADTSTAGSFNWPGDDLATVINGPGSMLNEISFSGIGIVQRQANASALNLNNKVTITGGMGFVLIEAFNNAPNSSAFPIAAGNGGWKDTLTITNPAHNGQAGTLVFTVNTFVFLRATGFAGSAAVRTTAYKDNQQLMINSLFNAGDSDVLNTDRQYGNYAIATFGTPNEDSKVVNDDVTFAVPFTFGTPFSLGVYTWGFASMRSSSSVGGNSTGLVEGARVRWGGIISILAGTTPVTGTSTVGSAAGKDWGPATQPPDACPGDFNYDGVTDDADFVIFVTAYNILDCADPAMPGICAPDMNGDGFVDDADFVEFLVAYNNLVCV